MSKQLFIIDIKNASVKTIVDNMLNAVREMSRNGIVSVELSFSKKSRSTQQNRYWHKLIGLIAENQGESSEKIKMQIKHKIGLIEKHLLNGELVTIIRSTADLNSEEFSKLVEETIQVCEYLEIEYPTPDYYGMDK